MELFVVCITWMSRTWCTKVPCLKTCLVQVWVIDVSVATRKALMVLGHVLWDAWTWKRKRRKSDGTSQISSALVEPFNVIFDWLLHRHHSGGLLKPVGLTGAVRKSNTQDRIQCHDGFPVSVLFRPSIDAFVDGFKVQYSDVNNVLHLKLECR